MGIIVKCRDLNKVSLDYNSFKPTARYKTKKDLISFDTETEKGKCFLIGYYLDKKDYDIKVTKSFKDVINFLFKRKFEETFNFFYNINYDFQAIIKFLPNKKLEELAKYDNTYFEDYLISVIPNKSFSISKGKHKVIFFDLAQFYNFNSLNNSAIKFLNMKKESLSDDGIDIKNLTLKRYENDYKYKFLLDKYLYRDIEITKLLCIKLYNLILPYIKPKSFYSQASFSQQYFLEHLNTRMNLPTKNILQYALNSYQGGRFEVFKKGFFEDAHIQDIKSAYPYHNIDVPDLSKGKWKQSKEYEPDSLVSLFKLDTNIHDVTISPIKYQMKDNLMIYPTGKFKDIYLNKKEVELLDDLGFKYKIEKAFHYFDKEPEYPYKFLKKFYELKEQYKREGKKELSWIPKIIINGFYGKTIQMNPKLEFTREFRGETDLYDMATYEDEYIYIYKKYKAGKLFNPIVANEITSNTRVQLFKSVIKDMNKVIGFQTDSIISSKKLNLNYGDKLGDWESETKGDMIILGSGVYQIIGKNPKVRLRGFSKGLDLQSLLTDNQLNNKIKVSLTRNNKLKKTFKSKLSDKERKKQFNLIIQDIKTININFDRKRIWERKFDDCKDVLENQIESKPITI